MTDANQVKCFPELLLLKLKPIADILQKWLQVRWVRIFLQLLILSFSIFYLIKSYQSVDLPDLDISLNFLNLIWSAIITIVALFLGGLGWWLTLLSVGQATQLGEAIRIHSISNLAKYIPGYAWQLLSKGYLTRKSNVPARLIGIAMTLELVQIFIAGIWLIVLFFPDEIYEAIPVFRQMGILYFILRYSLIAILSVFPIILPWIVRKIDPLSAAVQISSYQLTAASLSIVVGWLLFGIAFWLIGDAVVQIPPEHIPLFIFSLAVSFLVGFLIIIIPASIGVRESIMVFLLSSLITAPIAVVVAAVSRLILTICELIFAGMIHLYSRIARNQGKDSHFS